MKLRIPVWERHLYNICDKGRVSMDALLSLEFYLTVYALRMHGSYD